jgi:two-component system sensor histidine kinase KdpD
LKFYNSRKFAISTQFYLSIGLVLVTSLGCFFAAGLIGYRVVALVLLMAVSIVAMLFEILPVLSAAILSAIIWNFFFIPPLFTFHIENAEDILMFLLYFFIAFVNAVLTFKIRVAEGKARDKEEKENTIRLYNTLLNSLSHELRTPISTILGAVDTLKEEGSKLSAQNQTILLSEIDKASLRLNRQVENLLNMSRLESGTLQPKMDWCDLNELVNSLISKLQPSASQKLVFHEDENLPLFKLDMGLVEQIVHNLIHNAIQYTPPNSVIEIKVEFNSPFCSIIVLDNGNGFPEKAIEFAFDKFYRLPNSRAGGSGLGLSIVRGFVEALNGSVELENNPNGGAIFRVIIPAEVSFLNNLKHE